VRLADQRAGYDERLTEIRAELDRIRVERDQPKQARRTNQPRPGG
jgi:hypothetical protein